MLDNRIAVNTGKVGLLEIVKALGEYLTSTEDEVRLKGKIKESADFERR